MKEVAQSRWPNDVPKCVGSPIMDEHCGVTDVSSGLEIGAKWVRLFGYRGHKGAGEVL